MLKRLLQNSSQHFQVALQVLDLRPKNLWRMIRAGWAIYRGQLTAPSPIFLHVEPTGACNLKCPMCPRTEGISRPLGNMDLETFKGICDKVDPLMVAFVGFGEPLLCPQLTDMVRYAAQKGVLTRVSTNATLLDAPMARNLIRAGLKQIWFSLDSPFKQSYETLRPGATFEKVIANIQSFQMIAFEEKWRGVATITCTLTEKNIHEVSEMLRFCHDVLKIRPMFARGYGYDLEDKKQQTLKNTADIIAALRAGISRAQEYEERDVAHNLQTILIDLQNPLDGRGPCYFPYYAVAISWDGHLAPCCLYYDYQLDFEHLGQKDFAKIWNGTGFQKFRQDLRTQRFQLPICQGCPLNDISLHNLMATLSHIWGLKKLTPYRYEHIRRT